LPFICRNFWKITTYFAELSSPATLTGDVSQKVTNSTMSGWRPEQPCNDLPPLPRAGEIETRPVLKQCIAARAALAEYQAFKRLIFE
jgi:hypothetical protein